jgi:hypothetical protein
VMAQLAVAHPVGSLARNLIQPEMHSNGLPSTAVVSAQCCVNKGISFSECSQSHSLGRPKDRPGIG